MPSTSPIDVFIAYAKADTPLLERLRTQLSAAERIGLVDAWHDGEIVAGTDREVATQTAMENAEIILLLLSADFFASEYLYDQEMTQALALSKAGKATVIPVLLKDCTWQLSPLAKLEVLPKNKIPVTNKHWESPDQALKKVVDEVIELSNQIRESGGVPAIEYTPTEENNTTTKRVSKTIETSTTKDPTSNGNLVRNAVIGLLLLVGISYGLNHFFFNPQPPLEKKEQLPRETPSSPTTPSEEKPTGQESADSYPSQTYNGLSWMSQNLVIDHPESHCYNDQDGNCAKLGRLYLFKTAKQVCPSGWRLPTRAEWRALTPEQLGKLQLTKGGVLRNSAFRELGIKGRYWTSERSHGDEAWVIESMKKGTWVIESRPVHWAFSCRCVQ